MLMKEDGSENESQFDANIIFIKIDLLEENLFFLFHILFYYLMFNDYSILIFIESFMVKHVGMCGRNVIEFIDKFYEKCNNVEFK
jgi:hypothetical protein